MKIKQKKSRSNYYHKIIFTMLIIYSIKLRQNIMHFYVICFESAHGLYNSHF